jgi:hypothetical protein
MASLPAERTRRRFGRRPTMLGIEVEIRIGR